MPKGFYSVFPDWYRKQQLLHPPGKTGCITFAGGPALQHSVETASPYLELNCIPRAVRSWHKQQGVLSEAAQPPEQVGLALYDYDHVCPLCSPLDLLLPCNSLRETLQSGILRTAAATGQYTLLLTHPLSWSSIIIANWNGEKAAQSLCHHLSKLLLCYLVAQWVASCLSLFYLWRLIPRPIRLLVPHYFFSFSKQTCEGSSEGTCHRRWNISLWKARNRNHSRYSK